MSFVNWNFENNTNETSFCKYFYLERITTILADPS
jgi:hypothetical protein